MADFKNKFQFIGKVQKLCLYICPNDKAVEYPKKNSTSSKAVVIMRSWAPMAIAKMASGPVSAYIFEFNWTSWIEEAKPTASDGTTSDYFGNSESVGYVTIVF